MKTLEELKDILNIEFSYNGDLGILQHTTKANLQKIEELARLGIVGDKETYDELKKCTIDYFSKQLENHNGNVWWWLG